MRQASLTICSKAAYDVDLEAHWQVFYTRPITHGLHFDFSRWAFLSCIFYMFLRFCNCEGYNINIKYSTNRDRYLGKL